VDAETDDETGEATMLAKLGRFVSFLLTPVALYFRFMYLAIASLVIVVSAGVGWSIMLATFLCYSWALVLVGFGWLDWAASQSFWTRLQHGGLLVLLGTLLFAFGRLFLWLGVKKLTPVIGFADAPGGHLPSMEDASGGAQGSSPHASRAQGPVTTRDAREFDGITRIGGARVVRDATGQITRIGIARVVRDATGQITHIGGVPVARDITGRISHIGGVDVVRDSTDRITHVLGMPVARKR
jgi:hypothetical protein